MNRFMYTAFVAFWAVLGTVVVLALLRPAPAPDTGAAPMAEVSPETAAATPDPTLPAITMDEVARHADADSCWMVIEGLVYDFTAYIPKHPTRRRVMLEWCGREATAGMRHKGDANRPHTAWAWSLLDEYRIGRLAP